MVDPWEKKCTGARPNLLVEYHASRIRGFTHNDDVDLQLCVSRLGARGIE